MTKITSFNVEGVNFDVHFIHNVWNLLASLLITIIKLRKNA